MSNSTSSNNTDHNDPIVIVSMARTPIGGFQGELASLAATQLGAHAIQSTLSQTSIGSDMIDEVIMGCVLPAGLGQAPARQAAIGAGLDKSTPCSTINKVCGSGLKAVMYGYDQIMAGSASIIISGGMESMSNAPYLLPKARSGYRLGHGELIDHMFFDGLQNAYNDHDLMGIYAEQCAGHYKFTREAQDEFALESLRRASESRDNGSFDSEISAINVKSRKETLTINSDEQPRNARPEKIPTLRPAFDKDGTVTAANASSISDGAASLILMRLSMAENMGLTPLAKIIGHTNHAQEPEWFTTAPVKALEKLSDKTGIALKDIDLFEINEAFAVVTMAAMHDLDIPHDKVNIYGGACALGHPIGASGARILVTLINAMHNHDLKTGMATLCIGGGEAVALAVEKMS